MQLDKSVLEGMFRKMLEIRYFEEQVNELYKKGIMTSLAHPYIGEEAVAVGACLGLTEEDYITCTHRGHCHLIAKGGELKYMMAEILGKKTGYCQGKGGSMHIADFELGILGANGIVGGGFTIAVGAGLAAKTLNNGRVTICFFGDAATNEGSFHESMNMAGLWKLPVVFVCENNLYGISVSQARHMAITDIANRGSGYGIPGVVVDGMDVLAVHQEVQAAINQARQGEGPTLVECKTYRFSGHHVGDPGNGILYRSKEEMEIWKERCPIKKMEQYLLENNVIDQQAIAKIKGETKQLVAEAHDFALNSPFPEAGELLQGLYA